MSEETQEIVSAEVEKPSASEKPAPKKRAPRKKSVTAAAEAQELAEPEKGADQEDAVSADTAKRTAPKRKAAAKRSAAAKEDVATRDGAASDTPSAASKESDSSNEETTQEKPKRRTRKKTTDDKPDSVESPEDGPLAASNEDAPGKDSDKADKAAKEVSEGKDSKETKDAKDSSRQRQNQNQNRSSHNNNSNNNNKHDRRNQRDKRNQRNNRREPMVPQTTREDLEKLKVTELRAKAEELGVEHKGLLKAALIDAVLEAAVKAEGFVSVEGVLDVLADGYGFLRTRGYLPSEDDVYVGAALIRRNGLRKGDVIAGSTRPSRSNEKYSALQKIDTVNGTPLDELGRRPRFADMTPIFPDEPLVMEHGAQTITARVIDLCAPIGKGQRGLIVSPPKAGKTTILKDIAASIAANNPEVHLMCLLVDERPEEVTDMERSIKGEVMASTFDMPSENHVQLAEMVIERAKRLVENGEDVVILLDSITRLARAYNLVQPASGRILSGGVDSTALYPPKKFLGAARNIENGGSLTILASALIETGSKMDEVIFEEFKGTGNMEVKLDRQLADRRIFPAIDPVASGTRREDLLINEQEAPLIWAVRRVLANRNNTERAMEMLIRSLRQTRDNQEFLMRAAKKMQGRQADEQIEL